MSEVRGQKSDQEEPRFELRARDPASEHVLRILACLRRHHFGMAEAYLNDAIREIACTKPCSDGQWLEALVWADEMMAWRATQNARATAAPPTPSRSDNGNTAPSAAHAIPKSESTGTCNADPAAA